MNLTANELALLTEALAHRATRLEAIALQVKYGRHHDLHAAAMRKLRTRLIELRPATIAANGA